MKDLPAFPVTLYVNGSAAGEAQGDTTLHVWVEKGGFVTVTAVAGAVPGEDGSIRIPYGLQAPPLHVGSARADCRGETARLALSLHKQYCTLGIRFSAPPGWGKPLSLALRGSVDGFSLQDAVPLDGSFRCRLDGSLSCRLPRLRPGDPLWLDMVLEDSVLRSFPLGTCLEAAGYDWTAPDLADPALEIDISVTSIGFRTDLWSSGEIREIIL